MTNSVRNAFVATVRCRGSSHSNSSSTGRNPAGDGDVLFIDSSHVVKPYGDTLHELIYILPRLNKGVLVHIHDIFLPFDYLPRWSSRQGLVYTEQWLVALLLYGSDTWEVSPPLHPTSILQSDHVLTLFPPCLNPLSPGTCPLQVVWGSRIMMTEHSSTLHRMRNYPTRTPDGGSLWIRKVK